MCCMYYAPSGMHGLTLACLGLIYPCLSTLCASVYGEVPHSTPCSPTPLVLAIPRSLFPFQTPAMRCFCPARQPSGSILILNGVNPTCLHDKLEALGQEGAAVKTLTPDMAYLPGEAVPFAARYSDPRERAEKVGDVALKLGGSVWPCSPCLCAGGGMREKTRALGPHGI